MVDLAAEVVQAMASSAGGRLAAEGIEAVGRLISALRAKFRGNTEANGTMETVLREPANTGYDSTGSARTAVARRALGQRHGPADGPGLNTRSAEMAQLVSNMILYGVQFAKDLDDDVAAGVARRAIARPDAYLTTEEIYSGIVSALTSDEALAEAIPGHSHSEQDYRDFLGRVVRQLDAMRPWPERPFQPVDPSSRNLHDARLVARIKLGILSAGKRLHEPFGRAADGRQAMMLRLKSGAEVALVVGWWPDSKDIALLLCDSHRAAADVLEEFSRATGITRDEIAPVEPE